MPTIFTFHRAWLIERYRDVIPFVASEIMGKVPDDLADASVEPSRLHVRKAQEKVGTAEPDRVVKNLMSGPRAGSRRFKRLGTCIIKSFLF